MSHREMVIELISKLPEDTPLPDITREIELFAATRSRVEDSNTSEQAVSQADLFACYEDPEEVRLLNRFGKEAEGVRRMALSTGT